MKKIGIITAMKEEADHIINLLNLKKVDNLKNITVYENIDFVLVLCGIGKIQATIGTTYLLGNYDIEKLINIGIAGSLLGDNANIGDVFLVNKIIQHDMYLPFDGDHLYYAKKEIIINNKVEIDMSNFNFNLSYDAFCLTGDQFIDDIEKVTNLSDKYNAHIIEMEAFGVASVAREFNMLEKCIFIKAISDGADNNAKDEHMGNLDFAMKNSLEVLKKIIY